MDRYIYICCLVPFSSSQGAFIEWTFGQRFKEDCLVLDSFVALPLAAKVSLAAVPGKAHVFIGYNSFVGGTDMLWRQAKRFLYQSGRDFVAVVLGYT